MWKIFLPLLAQAAIPHFWGSYGGNFLKHNAVNSNLDVAAIYSEEASRNVSFLDS